MINTKKQIVVDIADAKLSNNTDSIIVTHSLGSCIGVCIYDKLTKYSAMLHYQLPESKLNAEKAKLQPFMFADTGMQLLLQKMQQLGCIKKNLIIKIAGGAEMHSGPDGFNIGKKNYLAIRKILWKQGLLITAQDIGGVSPRNLSLDIQSGQVAVNAAQKIKIL